jgi:Ca-activated chloride channel family protein
VFLLSSEASFALCPLPKRTSAVVACCPCCARCAGIQASEFKRKKLNLIILLDVSGSMGSPFDQYYYDQLGQQKNLTEAGKWRSVRCVAC